MVSNDEKRKEIKTLYKQLENKTKYMKGLANELGRKFVTVRSHWFSESNDWAVPNGLLDYVLEDLTKTVNQQA